MLPETRHRRKDRIHKAERENQKRLVYERSEGLCEIPVVIRILGHEVTTICAKSANDVCHIVPKGQGYWKGVHSIENGIAGCREHHQFTHTYKGRVACISLLRERYGYDYSDPHYKEYV